jgi:hypothetical protein
MGVFDNDTGDLIHGYTHDGGVALGGSRILDADFQYVFCDENENIIFGIRWDGTFYPGPQRLMPFATQKGQRDVAVSGCGSTACRIS